MASISSISSLLSRYFLKTDGTTTVGLKELLKGFDDTGITDTVSLSNASQSAVSSLLSTLGGTSSGTDVSSASSLYDLLLSAANTKLVKNSPALVNMIRSIQEADESRSGSSKTGATDTDIDLLSMSAGELLSIIQKYKALSSTTSSSAAIDETV